MVKKRNRRIDHDKKDDDVAIVVAVNKIRSSRLLSSASVNIPCGMVIISLLFVMIMISSIMPVNAFYHHHQCQQNRASFVAESPPSFASTIPIITKAAHTKITGFPRSTIRTLYSPPQQRMMINSIIPPTTTTTTTNSLFRQKTTQTKKWNYFYDSTRISIGRNKKLSFLYAKNQLLSYDEWMKQVPSQNIIKSIESISQKRSNNSGKVTVVASDVANVAGMTLSEAKRQCMLLATYTAGDIAVDADGELIYTYPTNFPQLLQEKSIKYKTTKFLQENVWPGLFWLVRVSFGLSLFVSIAVIFSAIFFIQTSSSSNRDDDDRRGRGGGFGGGGGFGYYWGPTPFDFLYYRPYGSYANSAYYMGDKDPDDMGLLESVFSYVFGDGNPNSSIEEKRIQLASQMIRQNNGAVTAEQLAPYCGRTTDNSISSSTTIIADSLPPSPDEMMVSSSPSKSSYYVDESYVLPLVSALNGEPQVTDDGDIIYVFPELQVSAATTKATSMISSSDMEKKKERITLLRAGLRSDATSREIMQFLNYNGVSTRGIVERSDLITILNKILPPLSDREKRQYQVDEGSANDSTLLLERPYEFTLAPGVNKILAGGLGLLNLGGALYLGNLLGKYISAYQAAGVLLPTTFVTLSSLYPFLLGYAILFNAIPLVRYFYIQKQNEQIQKRNQRRIEWRDIVNMASSSNATNQSSASLSKDRVVGKNNLISRIRKKLQSAKSMKLNMKKIDDKNIIFDTKQAMEDISYQKEKELFDQFDQKLLNNNYDIYDDKKQ